VTLLDWSNDPPSVGVETLLPSICQKLISCIKFVGIAETKVDVETLDAIENQPVPASILSSHPTRAPSIMAAILCRLFRLNRKNRESFSPFLRSQS
jgi:hypothetical protein